MPQGEISEHTVWELLSERRGIKRFLEDKDEATVVWVEAVAAGLQEAFSSIERVAFGALDSIPRHKAVEEQRSYTYELPCSEIVLAMYDGDDYARLIWDMIEPPKSEVALKELQDAVKLLRTVVLMDDHRWPEISDFLSNMDRLAEATSDVS